MSPADWLLSACRQLQPFESPVLVLLLQLLVQTEVPYSYERNKSNDARTHDGIRIQSSHQFRNSYSYSYPPNS
eukprot:scaffold282621_cov53-Prasinocladus_malaysianus.AAC.1